jgi:hypothetical protein
MKVAIVANLLRVKVDHTEFVFILKAILGIFKPITALKSPWKTAHYIGIKLQLYMPDN